MGDFSEEINSTFPNEYIKAMLNLRYTSHFLAGLGEGVLKPFGVSSAQYNILRILRGAKKPITMKVVKQRMIEKSPNATRLADKLYDKGLITRERCEDDRRVVYVAINQKGLKLLEEIGFETIDNQMNNLTDEEVKKLNYLLDKIRN